MCGYNGIIGDVCPKCGRTEEEHGEAFERIRRITGYLVGTLDRFNDAKRAEEADRVKHFIASAVSAVAISRRRGRPWCPIFARSRRLCVPKYASPPRSTHLGRHGPFR